MNETQTPDTRSDAEVILRRLVSEQDIRDTMRVHWSLDCLPEDLYWKPAMDELFPPTNAQAALIAAFNRADYTRFVRAELWDDGWRIAVKPTNGPLEALSSPDEPTMDYGSLLIRCLATHLRTEDAK